MLHISRLLTSGNASIILLGTASQLSSEYVHGLLSREFRKLTCMYVLYIAYRNGKHVHYTAAAESESRSGLGWILCHWTANLLQPSLVPHSIAFHWKWNDDCR